MKALQSAPWFRGLLEPASASILALAAICWVTLAFLTTHSIFADADRQEAVYMVLAAMLTLLVLVAVIVGIRRQSSREQTNIRFSTALENMTHGLCMFDADKRLVVCNRRYAELYRLPPELVQIGTPHEAIIEHRVANGIFADEKDAGATGARSPDDVSSRVKKLSDGRYIRIVRKPMQGHGWLAIHEDITEREEMAAKESRRSAIEASIAMFRGRIDEVLDKLSTKAQMMSATAAALLGSSDQTTQQAEGALSESDKASSNVTVVAGAAEELSNSIAEIGRLLDRTQAVVGEAVIRSEGTNRQYAELTEAAQKIGDVIKLIRNIAGQTNLLALNATIEAARAGEAGRGFVVVASEVKSLAVQTAKATEDISTYIMAVQKSISGAVNAVRNIEQSMHEISTSTSTAAASVLQQNTATSEITRNAVNAARGTASVVTVLTRVAEAATGTHEAAQTMLDASNLVDFSVGDLRAEIEGFLRKVAV